MSIYYYVKKREKKVVFATTHTRYTKAMSIRKIHHRRLHLPMGANNFIAAFEGIEGGFAIAAGVLAGLSFAELDRSIFVTVAVISVIVNGFNAASVKYSTEHYLDELDGREKHSRLRHYFLPAFIQFLSYTAVSILAILPIFVLDNIPYAIVYSCIVTILILLLAGAWRAHLLGMPRIRDGIETALLGTGIIFVGLASGWIVHIVIGA